VLYQADSGEPHVAVLLIHRVNNYKEGVEFLRKRPGIRKVVLFGHSGGGPTLSF
jgi:hypothetical protein